MQRDYDYFMTTSQTVYSNNLAFFRYIHHF